MQADNSHKISSLIFLKILKVVTNFVICCSLNWYFKDFPASHDMSFAILSAYVLYCKQYGPQTRLGSSLNRVHSLCFHDKVKPERHLNICNRRKMQTKNTKTKKKTKNSGETRFKYSLRGINGQITVSEKNLALANTCKILKFEFYNGT